MYAVFLLKILLVLKKYTIYSGWHSIHRNHPIKLIVKFELAIRKRLLLFECSENVRLLGNYWNARKKNKWIVYWNRNDFIFWKKEPTFFFAIEEYTIFVGIECENVAHLILCDIFHFVSRYTFRIHWILYEFPTESTFSHSRNVHMFRSPTQVLIEHNNTWWWTRILYKTCIGRCIKNWWIFRCQTIHFSTPFHLWMSEWVCVCCFRWYTFHLPFVSIKLAFHF